MDKEHKHNILVMTLGASWQILPELVGWTNSADYDFFAGNEQVAASRKQHNIQPVDEFWIVSTENLRDRDKMEEWYKKWNIAIKWFICKDLNDFSSEDDVLRFRSLLFRVVLKASEEAATLYLSLTGGRKTMSSDMYEAAMLFGCDALFHIIDIKSDEAQKVDTLLDEAGRYAHNFLPVVIDKALKSNFIISGGYRKIISSDYPLDADNKAIEDGSLVTEIARRKQQSSQVYNNFYKRIRNSENERDIFR
jgi:adenosine deaminase